MLPGELNPLPTSDAVSVLSELGPDNAAFVNLVSMVRGFVTSKVSLSSLTQADCSMLVSPSFLVFLSRSDAASPCELVQSAFFSRLAAHDSFASGISLFSSSDSFLTDFVVTVVVVVVVFDVVLLVAVA